MEHVFFRFLLPAPLLLPFVSGFTDRATAAEGVQEPIPVSWGDKVWELQVDPCSGALVQIENRTDPQHMNWLRDAGHWEGRDWIANSSPGAVTLDGQWGLVESPQTGLLHVAQVRRISDRAWEAVYTGAVLTVTVSRELDTNDDLIETYTLKIRAVSR
jgi:hypothetical protein